MPSLEMDFEVDGFPSVVCRQTANNMVKIGVNGSLPKNRQMIVSIRVGEGAATAAQRKLNQQREDEATAAQQAPLSHEGPASIDAASTSAAGSAGSSDGACSSSLCDTSPTVEAGSRKRAAPTRYCHSVDALWSEYDQGQLGQRHKRVGQLPPQPSEGVSEGGGSAAGGSATGRSAAGSCAANCSALRVASEGGTERAVDRLLGRPSLAHEPRVEEPPQQADAPEATAAPPDGEAALPALPAGLHVDSDGAVHLEVAPELDATGRGNPQLALVDPPTWAPTKVTWTCSDSLGLSNVLPEQLEQELRAALLRLTVDDMEITPPGGLARGERVKLADANKKNPPRITLSVGGGSGRHGGVRRLFYSHHRQGVKRGDWVSQPVEGLILRVALAVQSALARAMGKLDGEHAALHISINVYDQGYVCDWHHDNATPGQGGWARNSQRRGSRVYVLRLAEDPKDPPSQQLSFRDAKTRGGQRHFPLHNNMAYGMGVTTDRQMQHRVETGSGKGTGRIFAMCIRELELWENFDAAPPCRIRLTDAEKEAAAAAEEDARDAQRVEHMKKVLALLNQAVRDAEPGHVVDIAAMQRSALADFAAEHRMPQSGAVELRTWLLDDLASHWGPLRAALCATAHYCLRSSQPRGEAAGRPPTARLRALRLSAGSGPSPVSGAERRPRT